MMIRPVTDLRNHFPDVESALRETGTVYLTKNGYGAAVLLSIDEYMALTGRREMPVASKTASGKSTAASGRGFLKTFANPVLIAREKNAGRLHAQGKHGKPASGNSLHVPGKGGDPIGE